MDDIQYMTLEGKWSEPASAIEYYLPDTGGGEPLPGEVDGAAADGQSQAPLGGIQPMANCGSAPTYVTFRQSIDGESELMPERTYVRAVDYNGIFPDYILAEGFIGTNGRFTFNLPICDTSTIFDHSAPDVYFILETRTNNGLTASHGTFARRHWWRTGTYYNQTAAALKTLTITVLGANAEARNTQRIWHKVNQVREWERTATNLTFPVDILYPVSDYLGIADESRAALGQIQIVFNHAQHDSVLFHEYGHLVYYRRMMGETAYNNEHACNLSGACASFPPCTGCIGHNMTIDIGPTAAMIEGWADFFEALSTRLVDSAGDGWGAELMQSYYPTGLGAEARVGNYLWDIWDNGVDPFANSDPTGKDLVSPAGTANVRYAAIIHHFRNMPLTSGLQNVWSIRIKPSLSSQGIQNHCAVLRHNTLTAIDSVCSL